MCKYFVLVTNSVGKESACSAGDPGSIPMSGRSPGEGNGEALQYPCLENPMDRSLAGCRPWVCRVRHDWVTNTSRFHKYLTSYSHQPRYRSVQFSHSFMSDWSMPGFPVHHQLPELAQTHVYRVSDAIQPSHPLSSPALPAFSLSQHQGLLQWVSSSH